MNTPVRILDLTAVELNDFIKSLNEPASSADQIWQYVYRQFASDFGKMAELNPSLRQKLIEYATINTLKPLEEKVSADGQTHKILFQLDDKSTIESAMMFFRNSGSGRERRTVCVSSQVGCSIGCHFCATGKQGFVRNLTRGEIIEQILFFIYHFGASSQELVKVKNRIRYPNVVFMGMGEPLANYDNVRDAIAILNSPRGMGLGFHQITVSTSGLVPQINQIGSANLQFQLAVSLHAADDDLRNRLVPINRKYPLKDLISACTEYVRKTGRNIYFEYALFDKINDTITNAEELAGLLKGIKCSINLIIGNRVPASEFQPSPLETALKFQKKLITSGIRTMLRVSRGADIEAGCGQLRSRWLDRIELE